LRDVSRCGLYGVSALASSRGAQLCCIVGHRYIRSSMKTPHLTERVRLEGYPSEFLVIRVDMERETVALIPVEGVRPYLENVPFFDLRRCPPEAPGD
jgi:hypothetical protein